VTFLRTKTSANTYQQSDSARAWHWVGGGGDSHMIQGSNNESEVHSGIPAHRSHRSAPQPAPHQGNAALHHTHSWDQGAGTGHDFLPLHKSWVPIPTPAFLQTSPLLDTNIVASEKHAGQPRVPRSRNPKTIANISPRKHSAPCITSLNALHLGLGMTGTRAGEFGLPRGIRACFLRCFPQQHVTLMPG